MIGPRLRLIAALAAVGIVAAVAGCAPEPAPTPSPTGFASEEEAFAAAEETYRAYVDALNRVDLSDPATFEPVYAWTTGDANTNEREGLSRMHADGWVVGGATRTNGFFADSYTPGEEVVVRAVACSDVSSVSLTNREGESVVSPERQDIYALELEFARSPGPAISLRIASSVAIEDQRCF